MEEKREMNLFELIVVGFNGIKSLFKSTINLFNQTIRLSLQYFWIIGLIMSAFIFASYYITRKEQRIYKSTTMITFSREIKPMIINELRAINAMSGFDSAKFAELMNIQPKQAESFREIRHYQVIDFLNDSIADIIDLKNKVNLADTLNRCMLDHLGIRIYLKGSNDFSPFYKGLVNYFNKHSEIARVDSASKAMLFERIAFCNKELERLDKFSDYDYFGEYTRESVKFNLKKGDIRLEPSRKQLYYIDMLNLLKEKSYLTTFAAANKNVINFLSENPSIDIRPRWHFVAVFGVAGYILGLILAIMFKRRKQIWNYLKDTNY